MTNHLIFYKHLKLIQKFKIPQKIIQIYNQVKIKRLSVFLRQSEIIY